MQSINICVIKSSPHLFAEFIRAYDKIWILGDSFLEHTIGIAINKPELDGRKLDYIKTHYDISTLADHPNLNIGSDNILLRIKDCVITAINEEILLPKAMIIILDDDLMDAIDHYDYGITIALG